MKKAKSILALILALVMAMGCMVIASADEAATTIVENDADNGSALTPDAFNESNIIEAKLQSSEDVDYFKFTVAEKGLVVLNLNHDALASESTYFTVSIEKIATPNNVSIITFESKGSTINAASPAFGADAGDYLVKVTKGNVFDASLEYALSFTVEDVAYCEVEANDSFATATAMQYASDTVVKNAKKYYATISTAADKDYYKLTAPKEGYIFFFVENDKNAAGNYKVELKTYTSVGASSAETTLGAMDVTTENTLKASSCVGVSAGDYYFIVSGVDSTGGYRIFATFVEYADIEHEFNGNISYATEVLFTKSVEASVFDAKDNDYFKFVATENNPTFKINVAASTGNTAAGQWEAKVVNAEGELLAGSTFTASASAAGSYEFTEEIPAGDYYLVVTGGSVINNGFYTVSLSDVEDPEPTLGFLDSLRAIDWSVFFANFSEWIGQINIMGMISAIVVSIVDILSRL